MWLASALLCAQLLNTKLTPGDLVSRLSVNAAGEELWSFHQRSTGGSKEGYVVLRRCEVVAEFVTAIACGPAGEVKPPLLVKSEQPNCGECSASAAIEAIVTKSGALEQLKTVAGHAPNCALSALAGWKYQPGTLNGQPVDTILQYAVTGCRIEQITSYRTPR